MVMCICKSFNYGGKSSFTEMLIFQMTSVFLCIANNFCALEEYMCKTYITVCHPVQLPFADVIEQYHEPLPREEGEGLP